MEVKSVTYVKNRVAKFPDAITERGKKHVNELCSLSKQGFQTELYLLYNDLMQIFSTYVIGIQICNALYKVKEYGVNIWCIKAVDKKRNDIY